ncbi:uncharacterized protein LOC126378320 [Pectinophora gossypiella]|uniref:uncharacterized protein LOC126378320 n=1 Tax=Pectinophora gossypiella TaxID=13191 RepID=UPI00214E0700|nr:uncharacterized protein LOC126378320 [Pectinophora gossypiella]
MRAAAGGARVTSRSLLAHAPRWLRRADTRLQRAPAVLAHFAQRNHDVQERRDEVRRVLSGLYTALRGGLQWDAALESVAATHDYSRARLKQLWGSVRGVAMEKLRLLQSCGDQLAAACAGAELRAADWLAIDLALLYGDDQLVTEDSLREYSQLSTLTELFSLVQQYQLHAPGTTEVWWRAALTDYTSKGRASSLVVLQRRWHELLAAARRALAAYSRRRGRAPPPLLRHLAYRYPTLVRQQQLWRQLVAQGAIHAPPLSEYLQAMDAEDREEYRDDTTNQHGGAHAHSDDEDDLILVEQAVETIDLAGPSDDEDDSILVLETSDPPAGQTIIMISEDENDVKDFILQQNDFTHPPENVDFRSDTTQNIINQNEAQVGTIKIEYTEINNIKTEPQDVNAQTETSANGNPAGTFESKPIKINIATKSKARTVENENTNSDKRRKTQDKDIGSDKLDKVVIKTEPPTTDIKLELTFNEIDDSSQLDTETDNKPNLNKFEDALKHEEAIVVEFKVDTDEVDVNTVLQARELNRVKHDTEELKSPKAKKPDEFVKPIAVDTIVDSGVVRQTASGVVGDCDDVKSRDVDVSQLGLDARFVRKNAHLMHLCADAHVRLVRLPEVAPSAYSDSAKENEEMSLTEEMFEDILKELKALPLPQAGAAGELCCAARRHLAYNAARQRLARRRGETAPIVDLHSWSHEAGAACTCCCGGALRGGAGGAAGAQRMRAAAAALRRMIHAVYAPRGGSDGTPTKASSAPASTPARSARESPITSPLTEDSKDSPKRRGRPPIHARPATSTPVKPPEAEAKPVGLANDYQEWLRQRSLHRKYFHLAAPIDIQATSPTKQLPSYAKPEKSKTQQNSTKEKQLFKQKQPVRQDPLTKQNEPFKNSSSEKLKLPTTRAISARSFVSTKQRDPTPDTPTKQNEPCKHSSKKVKSPILRTISARAFISTKQKNPIPDLSTKQVELAQQQPPKQTTLAQQPTKQTALAQQPAKHNASHSLAMEPSTATESLPLTVGLNTRNQQHKNVIVKKTSNPMQSNGKLKQPDDNRKLIQPSSDITEPAQIAANIVDLKPSKTDILSKPKIQPLDNTRLPFRPWVSPSKSVSSQPVALSDVKPSIIPDTAPLESPPDVKPPPLPPQFPKKDPSVDAVDPPQASWSPIVQSVQSLAQSSAPTSPEAPQLTTQTSSTLEEPSVPTSSTILTESHPATGITQPEIIPRARIKTEPFVKPSNGWIKRFYTTLKEPQPPVTPLSTQTTPPTAKVPHLPCQRVHKPTRANPYNTTI